MGTVTEKTMNCWTNTILEETIHLDVLRLLYDVRQGPSIKAACLDRDVFIK